MDRQTPVPIRRYERERPGELVDVDVKKLGRMLDGGGHRVHGRGKVHKPRSKRGRTGYTYLHTAIDDHSRLAYTDALGDESGATAAAFWRGPRPDSEHGGRVERVLTDNHFSYRGLLFNAALAETGSATSTAGPITPNPRQSL